MNSSRHNIFRKIIASVLLALLVFVYAEKFSHTHHNIAHTEQTGYSSTTTINATCAICDFTLAKDAALPEPDCINIPFTFIQQQYAVASITYHFLPERHISNKGPPAC